MWQESVPFCRPFISRLRYFPRNMVLRGPLGRADPKFSVDLFDQVILHPHLLDLVELRFEQVDMSFFLP